MITILGLFYSLFLLNSCATYTTQYKKEHRHTTLPKGKIAHSFYLVGNAGNTPMGEQTELLNAFQNVLDTVQHQNSHVLFLGDNSDPKGMPKKKSKNRKLAEYRIDAQVEATKSYKGDVIFIPGNRDWYSDGVQGVVREAQYINKKWGDKRMFLPTKGCPLQSVAVNEKIQLLIVDTQWYLTNWDKNPTINDNCEIKTRTLFFQEIEDEFKKHAKKTIVIAMHHPLYSNGPHGGKFSADRHLFPENNNIPLPVLGSLVTQVRSQGGVLRQDTSNQQFLRFKKRISTMARAVNRVVFVSGHEHSLQYIKADGIPQIISGSGSNITAAGLGAHGIFSHPGQGFSVLDVYTNGASSIRFFGVDKDTVVPLYQTIVHQPEKDSVVPPMKNTFESQVTTKAYPKTSTKKSKLYTTFWGDHYRYVYGTPIRATVAILDTLLGGVIINRAGGGQQTRSLRLINTEGKRYSLRAIQKSATQFLQKGAFRNTYVDQDFDQTYTERLLLDFYTASHPYANFVVGPMANAIGVYHTNPKLYYIPKHKALGQYNVDYGNELYVLEEHPGKEFFEKKSFGQPSDIESTRTMFRHIRKNDRYQIDETTVIRARIFDMLLGDWDRHPDQWRWARFDTATQRLYRPIPRDRDQVFSNYDGIVLHIARFIIPKTRKFQVYKDNIKSIRWLNESGIQIDRALIQQSTKSQWIAEAQHIQKTLTDEAIDSAFTQLPIAIQDETTEKIKRHLKARRDAVVAIAERYYKYLARHVTIRGTDKKDYFNVIRDEKSTRISVSRIKKGKIQSPYYQRTLWNDETNEIWIYGLDDDDQFEETGDGKHPIPIRIIGGQNNDQYRITNGKNIRIYDHKTKPNTFTQIGKSKIIRSDTYERNLYDYTKYIDQTNTVFPSLGFNPDDGINVNVTNVFTTRGFYQNPFQSKHRMNAAYYVATRGYDISYSGVFKNAIHQWDMQIEGSYTSDNFAQNFFGLGNDAQNPDKIRGMDYNRVRISTRILGVGISNTRFSGGQWSLKTRFETHRIDDTANRYITDIEVPSNFFKRKFFIGFDGGYHYENSDNRVNPTQGMLFDIHTGIKSNIDDGQNTFGYFNTKLSFHNAMTTNRKLVLKTTALVKLIVGDGFEFYQGATLGGIEGLRGYRNQRFIGDHAVALGADLRYSFNRIKTGLLPLQFGIFGGADAGRVWLDGEDSDRWHTDIGGGFWTNIVDAVMGQLGVFVGNEGARVTINFGVNL